jgi:hypothetical protein
MEAEYLSRKTFWCSSCSAMERHQRFAIHARVTDSARWSTLDNLLRRNLAPLWQVPRRLACPLLAAGSTGPTVKRAEADDGIRVSEDALVAIASALKKTGVEFLVENGGGPGFRLRKPQRAIRPK